MKTVHFFIVSICVILVSELRSQTVLKANGSTETYSLINSVLAPGYTAVEPPDCSHTDFGPHIDQVFDAELQQYVFRFQIHTSPDNDRCISFDRQRNEIKTYDSSPDNLKATIGENVVYKWKFKLPANFQPSSNFTHIHQIKAVGGSEESMPLITLTPRKASPNRLELRYSDHLDQITLTQIDLSKVLDRWIQATETIGVGEHGSYSLLLEDIADKSIVLNYAQADTRVWKTDADFLRPKWGIYRSLLDKASLRDEMLYFADFSIEEKSDLPEALSTLRTNAKQYSIYPNPAATHFTIKDLVILPNDTALLYNAKGQLLQTFSLQTNQIAISTLVPGAYYLVLRNNRLTKAYIPFVKE